MLHNIHTYIHTSQLPDLNEVGRSRLYGGKRPPCHLCDNMKDTCTFKSKHLNKVHRINKKYNCNAKMAVYLIECEICGEQYTGSTKTKFRSRANNYKIRRESLWAKRQALKQKHFHEDYCSDRYNGIEDWVITLTDSADTLKELRRKKLYWMHKRKIYALCGLNERDVYEAFLKFKIDCMFSIYNKVTRGSLIMNGFFISSFSFLSYSYYLFKSSNFLFFSFIFHLLTIYLSLIIILLLLLLSLLLLSLLLLS